MHTRIDTSYANRDKINNRLKARRLQLTRRLISDQTGEILPPKNQS